MIKKKGLVAQLFVPLSAAKVQKSFSFCHTVDRKDIIDGKRENQIRHFWQQLS